uniref:Uncharacterized protein n=1 Tax=viral metagenome TaxID=1070528 RepID=A0A6M3LYA5_9ZZZZ
MAKTRWELRRDILKAIAMQPKTTTDIYHTIRSLPYTALRIYVEELEKKGFLTIRLMEKQVKASSGHGRQLLSSRPTTRKIRKVEITPLGKVFLGKIQDTFAFWNGTDKEN